MRILAIDIGLASMGWAVLDVEHNASGGKPHLSVAACGVWVTEKEAKKRQLHTSSDDARRIDILVDRIEEARRTYAPQLCAYELPAGQKGARAAHALGAAHGLVRAALRVGRAAVVEVTALDAKVAATGSKVASKQKVIDAVTPIAADLERIPKTEREHAADAVAVAIAAASSEVARMTLALGAARTEVA